MVMLFMFRQDGRRDDQRMFLFGCESIGLFPKRATQALNRWGVQQHEGAGRVELLAPRCHPRVRPNGGALLTWGQLREFAPDPGVVEESMYNLAFKVYETAETWLWPAVLAAAD